MQRFNVAFAETPSVPSWKLMDKQTLKEFILVEHPPGSPQPELNISYLLRKHLPEVVVLATFKKISEPLR